MIEKMLYGREEETEEDHRLIIKVTTPVCPTKKLLDLWKMA
jgi:hypothetical protein